ncbi:MAG: type II CAAX prenyl endopeptidase Rce1 family protein [Fidelibacterota bacterium]
MSKLSKSNKIFIGLVILFAILASLNLFLPQGDFTPKNEIPVSKPILAVINFLTGIIIYGGLGLLGIKLSKKLEIADIWDKRVTNRQRFLKPLLTGIFSGILLIIGDWVFANFHDFGRLPHPPFPASLVASAAAGIGEEIIFRLFFISFWVWLISKVLFRGNYEKRIFWIVSVISALAFAFAHLPATMILFGFESVTQIPAMLFTEIIVLNGIVSILAAIGFRKYGFLAAAGIHFWTDVVWHVIWGLL